MATLTVDHLGKTFPAIERGSTSTRAIDDLSFTWRSRVRLGRGAVGMRKSTLLNILSGVETASAGTVTVAEGDRPARLGYVFQDPRPPMADRGADHALRDRHEGKARARDEYLDMVGPTAPATSSPRSCRAAQQRVGIARAFAVEPDLLLMDEPFSHLDAITARSLREQLQDIWTRPRRRCSSSARRRRGNNLPTASSCWRQAADSTPMSTSTCRDPARLPTRTSPRCRRSSSARFETMQAETAAAKASSIASRGGGAHGGRTCRRARHAREEVLSSIDVPRELLIGGEWVGAASGERIPVTDPSTGRQVTDVAGAGESEVDAARSPPQHVRRRRLEPHDAGARAGQSTVFADAIEGRIDDLYQLETLCNGRPIGETKAQLGRLPEWYRYNAALLVADRTDVIQACPYHVHDEVPSAWWASSAVQPPDDDRLEEPRPALLATGNSVVLKPSGSPLTSLLLGGIALESGLPAAVMGELIPGIGAVAGARLASHPNVEGDLHGRHDRGSRSRTRRLEHFAKVTVELGGKTPVMASTTSTSRRHARVSRSGRSSPPDRRASAAAGCWCSARSTTSSSGRWSRSHARSASAIRSIPRHNSGR